MNAWRVAAEEWRLLARNRVAVVFAVVSLVLTSLAAVVASERQRAIDGDRHRYQQAANAQFDAQPDRHPHRVVHYGHFVFRPLGSLAGFDPGIEPLVGHMVYLEGHRQNTANFADARQSSLLLRFGEFTPAFVLQTLAPLLLIFLGFGVVTRERENGTLRLMLSQGTSAPAVVAGKWASLAVVGVLCTLPAFFTLLLAGGEAASSLPAAISAAAYLLYLCVWAGIVVFASALLPRGRDALLALVGLWAVLVIVLPRVLPEVAALRTPLPTRLETDIAIHRDLAAMGDSHNPDDPYFSGFRQEILDRYGVQRIEDLPLNYAGLMAVEGERMTAALFDQYAEETFALLERQSDLVASVGLLTPLSAARRVSMAAAQTDLNGYRLFLEQTEDYRFGLVQALNRMQAELLTYADDTDKTKENRIDAAHFRQLPEFDFKPQPAAELITRTQGPLIALIAWFAALVLANWGAARRLPRIMA